MFISIDLDNTVNDFDVKFLKYYNNVSGNKLGLDDLKDYDLTSLGIDRETLEVLFFKNDAFYRTLEANPVAVQVVKNLCDAGHDITFVSAADYSIIGSRVDFVKKYFPFIDVNKSLIMTEEKGIVFADVVIEDLNKNLRNANYICTYILLKKPWNINDWNIYRDTKYDHEPGCADVYACTDWNEIRDALYEMDAFKSIW